jgi:hypothetical protein
MKKYFLIALLLALFAIPGITQNDCGLFITTDFTSECILTEYPDHQKPQALEDSSLCFHACQGNIVKYYAEGMVNASYEWNVQGSDTWQVLSGGEAIAVTWPDNGQSGNIIVTATDNDSGHTCTFNRCIDLISKPVAGIQTFPEHDVTIPVLTVCLNQTVQFIDNSSGDAEAPITGYLWEWEGPYPTHTTQNMEVTFNQAGSFLLVHEVVNECGCTDKTLLKVEVNDKPSLQLDCYGTACANSPATYRIVDMECSDYTWEITGGDLISFNYPELQIEWHNPASGYGVIRLNGTDCENLCEGNTYITVPIMSDGIEIDGPTEACVGDVANYQIPLYGASTYFLEVTGPDHEIYDYTSPNQMLVQFNMPGNYTIKAKYFNEVLPDCGLNIAQDLEVYVKDTFSIDGPLKACQNESIDFTAPWTTDNFYWEIHDENGNLVYSQQNAGAINYSFQNSGVFEISAENDNYCKKAKTYITINPSPEPVPLASISGPQTACPNASAVYNATPTNPLYYTAWVCNCANPSSWSGEEFTANFGSSVCDVGVYQVNRITGCISDTTWYNVDEFQPQVNSISVPAQSCANAVFDVSVQPENNVLYEWSVSPETDASVVGDIFGDQNSIQVNDVDATNLTVTLTRNYCNNQDQLSATVPIIPVVEPILDFPGEICENDYLTLNVQNPSQLNGSYSWDVNGTTYTGLGTNALINFTGDFTITLTYTPNNCGPVTVVTNIYAVPAPNANITSYSATGGTGLTVSVQDDNTGQFQYQWSTGQNTPSIVVSANGTYYCTVTNSNNCATVVDYTLPTPNSEPTDTVTGNLLLNRTFNGCADYSWTATGYIGTPVSWAVTNPGANTTISGTDNQNMQALFSQPGLYTIIAEAPDGAGNIYRGADRIAIPCIPEFEVQFECDPANDQSILMSIDDQTAYLDNTSFISSYWTVDAVQQSGTIPLQTGATYTIELVKEYYYEHPETSEVFSGTCTETQNITVPQRGQAAFSIEDDPNFCAETPVVFNDLSTGNIIRWEWEFDDGASLIGQNAQRAYSSGGDPTPSLTITDSYGCTSYAEQQITVAANGLDGVLSYDLNGPFCSGNAWELNYNFFQNPQSSFELVWMPEDITTTSNTHNVYQTGNYYVLLEDENGCRAQSNMVNLGFLNSPTASIHGLTSYCPEEDVNLLGDIGDEFTYTWQVSGPASFSSNDANLSYQGVPNIPAGDYTNELTVEINHGGVTCSDQTAIITHLHEAGPAPDIDYGQNPCLTYGPVDMISNSGPVYWSNGNVGDHTQYFNPGWMNAYQIDPVTGCESEKATEFITPTPDYDGVLTGCYKKCPEWFVRTIYAFINPVPVDWDWIHENTLINQGNSREAILDLPWFGTYYMKTNYDPGCHSNSPDLIIKKKEHCDSTISFKDTRLKCFVQDCNLIYDYFVDINNTGSQNMTINDVDYPGAVFIGDNLPLNIPPNSNATVNLEFIPPDPSADYINMQLEVIQNGVVTYADAPVSTDMLDNPEDCFTTDCSAEFLAFEHMASSQGSVTYKFTIAYDPDMENIVLHSDAGSISDYSYSNGELNGYIEFSSVWVTNFCADTSQPEMCFELTGCHHDMFCTASVCVGQEDICGGGSKSLLAGDEDKEYTKGPDLYLAPNPAKTHIHIFGEDSNNIKQLHVLDLKGNYLLSKKSNKLDISTLLPATYIVRIDLQNGKVDYLKLIKQ